MDATRSRSSTAVAVEGRIAEAVTHERDDLPGPGVAAEIRLGEDHLVVEGDLETALVAGL